MKYAVKSISCLTAALTMATVANAAKPGVVSRAPDFTMRRLRCKIEEEPNAPVHLLTVTGEGYRLAGVQITDAAPAPQPAPPSVHAIGRSAAVQHLVQRLRQGPPSRVSRRI